MTKIMITITTDSEFDGLIKSYTVHHINDFAM